MVRLILLLAFLLVTPLAGAQEGAGSTAFATLRVPAYVPYQENGTRVAAQVQLHPGPWWGDVEHVFLAVRPRSEALVAEMLPPTDGHGQVLPAERSQESGPRQHFSVSAASVSPSQPIRVEALVAVQENGRHRLGFLAIGFDSDWKTVRLPDGTSADAYVEMTVPAYTVDSSRPFVGAGNVPGPGGPAALLVLGALALARRR